jgi:predicted AAA+ superfamily ATPase
MPNTAAEQLFERVHQLLDRLETWLPPAPATPDWSAHAAFRWHREGRVGSFLPIPHLQPMPLERLSGIDTQKQKIFANTAQFVAGKPANNVLLTGARGTGKSSLIKAMLTHFSAQGLRMIEVKKAQLADLHDISAQLADRPERFIIFCDDISFGAEDNDYLALKVALDGSLASAPDNVLIYASSNRRHLMPESQLDNAANGEIHPNENVEEKISLSDRFGLWLSFYPFDQEAYLACVATWIDALDVKVDDPQALRAAALQWALVRGNRSGRSARQFVNDWAGKSSPASTT